ncbi:4'-phosphopantetheinyl transferase superfamily protein [Nocardia sp. BMG51109]|uniref:4'-phosphopantetheinyl transferase family protein n=1 Tax=Nocardia sp. BMG51109 TaxID=1056816 RepID=UPI0004657163|nr:4'-phosphopantetheinyl transferase superfamily protein [Nocardia sp. BMG51109]
MTTVAVVVDWRDTPAVPCDLLNPAEQRVAQGFPAWRRREWTAGRLTAHTALLLAFGYRAHEVNILADLSGAPATGLPRCAISLSHSDSLSVGVATDESASIGIDIEHVDRRITALTPRITVPSTVIRDPLHATALWACKEAAIKVCRTGPFRMREYSVSFHDDGARVVVQGRSAPLRASIRHFPGLRALMATAAAAPGLEPALMCFDGTGAIRLLERSHRSGPYETSRNNFGDCLGTALHRKFPVD